MTASPPVVLTIGGSDSGGCYGIQTDLRVLAARRVHAATVLTVVTAQNTSSLRSALPLPVDLIEAQLEAVLTDLPVAAVKTGMLGRVEVVDVVARFAAAGRLPNLVVDPVLVDRHGRALFDRAVVGAYRSSLVPHATVVCPNGQEADLLGEEGGPTDGAALAQLLGVPTLVTGGRSPDGDAVDVLWDGAEPLVLRSPRIATVNNAGSGDALSAHIAAGLAEGLPLRRALVEAKERVHAALSAAAGWVLGSGPGPLDHTARP